MTFRILLTVLLVAVAGLPATPAGAQGFFQQLFGNQKLPLPAPRPYLGGDRPYQSYGDGFQDHRGGGSTYRTLCVRLCDGYYFPISFSTTRSEFARDAEKCSASCGGDARLFYHPNPGGEVETMVDLTGMGYAQLSTAFKYRKTLVKGCTCRPLPWSDAEVARHRAYGGERVAAAPRSVPDEAASGARVSEAPEQPQLSTVEAPLVIERPEPVSRYVLPSRPRSNISDGAPRSPFGTKRGSPGAFFR